MADINWTPWVHIALGVVNLSISAWLFLDKRNDKTQTQINELRKSIDERLTLHSGRLAQVETEVKGLPTHDHIGEVHEKINLVAVSSGRIEGELGFIRRMVEDMNRYMRESK